EARHRCRRLRRDRRVRRAGLRRAVVAEAVRVLADVGPRREVLDLEVITGERVAHVVAEDPGRDRAAVDATLAAEHAPERLVVRTTDPHRRGQLRGEAAEPRVLVLLGRAGLAGGRPTRDLRPGAG